MALAASVPASVGRMRISPAR